MIYFPLEAEAGGGGGGGGGSGGWADGALSLLGYDRSPARLQAAVRSIFARATSRIALRDAGGAPVRVAACPLFTVLDPKIPSHYTARVEPSAQGANRMAAAFVRLIEGASLGVNKAAGTGASAAGATAAGELAAGKVAAGALSAGGS